ncbi:hypothetical protein I8D63_001763 [Vibrio parahaemolyticus]|uniref:hypothetical protein n=1 Tax=Vibrio harveyi group TaxID=717610 RepID=UPI0006CA68CC|nr:MULTISPECIES: hypothetical protein [Vibrio harveyi group]EGR9012128.1 hypothetical protein [Vibrio parahaemolyticus]TOA13633.1 hypothetical protein CGK33_19050 [Vibrio parahaemolyticus]
MNVEQEPMSVGEMLKPYRNLFGVENLIRSLNFFSVVAIIVYLYSMFIHPFIEGKWSWQYVHGVWYSWQALNVGMLAFGSSIIALNISRYHAAKQLEREFIAAKAFLPQALKELCDYFRKSAKVLSEAYESSKEPKRKRNALKTEIPDTPERHIPVFKECIKSATPDVAEYLAKILVLLQIHDARMQEIRTEGVGNPSYRKSCLYSLAELQVLVDDLFDFARSEKPFSDRKLTAEKFSSAFAALSFNVSIRDELEAYVKNKQL